jgi:hypothetical protein
MVSVKRGDWISLVNANANRTDAINIPARLVDGKYERFSCM